MKMFVTAKVKKKITSRKRFLNNTMLLNLDMNRGYSFLNIYLFFIIYIYIYYILIFNTEVKVQREESA